MTDGAYIQGVLLVEHLRFVNFVQSVWRAHTEGCKRRHYLGLLMCMRFAGKIEALVCTQDRR